MSSKKKTYKELEQELKQLKESNQLLKDLLSLSSEKCQAYKRRWQELEDRITAALV